MLAQAASKTAYPSRRTAGNADLLRRDEMPGMIAFTLNGKAMSFSGPKEMLIKEAQ
jgi:hypothetical protein